MFQLRLDAFALASGYTGSQISLAPDVPRLLTPACLPDQLQLILSISTIAEGATQHFCVSSMYDGHLMANWQV